MRIGREHPRRDAFQIRIVPKQQFGAHRRAPGATIALRMAAFSYRIVNVFTRGGAPLSGNPLCVFERAQALDVQRMQALALQFNLSETSFILPSERASAAVRIFTPRYEMPFAGHPTLGTAHVCRALGLGGDRLTLELPAGIIAVRATGDRWTLQAMTPRWRASSAPSSRGRAQGRRRIFAQRDRSRRGPCRDAPRGASHCA